jgi:hypothetical protein
MKMNEEEILYLNSISEIKKKSVESPKTGVYQAGKSISKFEDRSLEVSSKKT